MFVPERFSFMFKAQISPTLYFAHSVILASYSLPLQHDTMLNQALIITDSVVNYHFTLPEITHAIFEAGIKRSNNQCT